MRTALFARALDGGAPGAPRRRGVRESARRARVRRSRRGGNLRARGAPGVAALRPRAGDWSASRQGASVRGHDPRGPQELRRAAGPVLSKRSATRSRPRKNGPESRKPYRRAIDDSSPRSTFCCGWRTHPGPRPSLRGSISLLDAYLSSGRGSPGAGRASARRREPSAPATRSRRASIGNASAGLSARFGDLEIERSTFPDFQAVTDCGQPQDGQSPSLRERSSSCMRRPRPAHTAARSSTVSFAPCSKPGNEESSSKSLPSFRRVTSRLHGASCVFWECPSESASSKPCRRR